MGVLFFVSMYIPSLFDFCYEFRAFETRAEAAAFGRLQPFSVLRAIISFSRLLKPYQWGYAENLPDFITGRRLAG
jgi:hypothetical protein